MYRIGVGSDSHRTIDGRALILGGEYIPFSAGLKGHSDGDALCPAITDAILGAAAQGDIGRHFPDTAQQYEGANSLALLGRAVGLVMAAACVLENGDAWVMAAQPKLAPHVDRIRATLAKTLGVAVDAVGVKGKTNEGKGEGGRGGGQGRHARAP